MKSVISRLFHYQTFLLRVREPTEWFTFFAEQLVLFTLAPH